MSDQSVQMKRIPVVDLEDFNKDERSRDRLIETIGQAFHDIGFVFIRAPEIVEELPPIYDEFRKLFSLPTGIKARYKRPEIHYQRGWTPSYEEIGIACRALGIDQPQLPDAKECWFIGPDLPEDHPMVREYADVYYPNIWPKEVPGFRPAMEQLYDTMFNLGKRVLAALGTYLEQPEGYFEDMVTDSPTVLRCMHYPPVSEMEVGNIVWGCKHTDINLITILPGSTRSGLWIKRRDGEWIPGKAPEGCVIAQVGDMLQYITGGDFLSAEHEIRAPDRPTEEGRYSSAMFIHARSDAVLEPFVSDEKKDEYPPMTAYDMLLKRLKEIGLADDD